VRRKPGAKIRADEQEPDDEAYGAGRAKPAIAEPISIKGAGGKSGGRVSKAVEPISGDLLWVTES
jgi:hypothetical protein